MPGSRRHQSGYPTNGVRRDAVHANFDDSDRNPAVLPCPALPGLLDGSLSPAMPSSLRRLVIVLPAIAVAIQCAAAPSPAKATPGAKDGASHAATKSKQPRVYVGMPAKELEALIGKPQKIVPVTTPVKKGTHAEVWIYKRLKQSTTESVTIGSKPIMGRRPTGDGSWTDTVLTTEPIDKTRVTNTYQIASFLIVNGRFVATTLTEERDQHFQ